MPDLHSICSDFLTQEGCFPASTPIIAAVSGGMDSTVLAHILLDLGFQTTIAHCDFGLRAESAAEAIFVQKTFSMRGAEVIIQQFETQAFADQEKISIQVAARKLRYEWFERLLLSTGAPFCVTAHHADDQIETLMLHWIKGNSPLLMKGIPHKREKFLRPLLNVFRKDILAFAVENKIEWMEDASNQSLKYQRNQVRNSLLPEIEKINPSFRDNILEHYGRYSKQHSVLRNLLDAILQKCLVQEGKTFIYFWETAVKTAGEKAANLFLEFWLMDQGWEGKLIPAVLNLCASQTGKMVRGNKWLAEKNRGTVIFLPLIPPYSDTEPFSFPEKFMFFEENEFPIFFASTEQIIRIQKVDWTGQIFEKECLYFDVAKIEFPIVIRKWQAGDKMIPLGMKNEKKLSDIFTDEKISLLNKSKAWVIEDQNQIAGLTGFRIAEYFRIDSSTTKVYEIRIL